MRNANDLQPCSLKDSNLQPTALEESAGGRDTVALYRCDAQQSVNAPRAPRQNDQTDRSASVVAFPSCARCPETRPEAFARRVNRGRVRWQPYCKACQVEYHRQWREKPENRAKMRAGVTASRKRYPEKERARNLLRQAVKRGDVTVGACYAAGPDCSGGIESHHDDYAKPLDVTWTCRGHHRALDRARRATRPHPSPRPARGAA
jgi:hypothetical protein